MSFFIKRQFFILRTKMGILKKKNNEEQKKLMVIIDSSALQGMFEGKEDGKKLLEKLNEMGYEQSNNVVAVSPMSSFLRAIYLSDSEVKIGAIQKALNFLQIAPSFADFKDEKAVINEILAMANAFGEAKKNAIK